MVKKLTPVFLLVIVLQTSCKQSSFLKQKYTRYGHVKQEGASSRAATVRTPKVNSHPVISRQESVSAEPLIPALPENSAEVPKQSAMVPVRHIENGLGIVCSAGSGAYSTAAIKNVKAVPAKIERRNQATGIPIISPVLRIVFLALLIVLVVLLIVLFV